MKLRSGYVSNSSTTSFCIVGISVDKLPENINTICDGSDLSYDLIDPNIDGGYIGLSIKDMKDNETLKEFKERARVEISKIFPNYKVDNIYMFINGYYNG